MGLPILKFFVPVINREHIHARFFLFGILVCKVDRYSTVHFRKASLDSLKVEGKTSERGGHKFGPPYFAHKKGRRPTHIV